MTGRPWRALPALVATLVVATACSGDPGPSGGPARRSGPAPTAAPRAWAAVGLPDGSAPLLVRAADGGVLVAGRAGDRATMVRLDEAGTHPVPVPLEPHGVYAATALWVDLATDGSRVLALGRASGGAHGLPRWTVWDGGPRRVVERPQPFETFGGPRSAGLAGVAFAGRPVVAGSWDSGGPGLDARLWQAGPAGQWVRLPVAGPLASTASRLPQPSAVGGSTRRLVVAGSTTELGGPQVRTRATAWSAPTPGGPWARIELPVTTVSSRATAVTCLELECWVVGLDGGAPLLWRLPTTGPAEPVALPHVEPTPDVAPVLAVRGATTWVGLDRGGSTVLVRRDAGAWQVLEGPAGRPMSLTATSTSLVLVTRSREGTRLWTAPAR